MRRTLLFSLFYLLILVLHSCDTRRYVYQESWVTVEFSIDWTELALASKSDDTTPNGATVMFYPTSGVLEDVLIKLTNYTEDKVTLPRGTYNVIVFNETVNGHDYIQFTGAESYDTFEAYWETTRVKAEYSRSDSDEMIMDTDDFLLIDRMEGFEITYDDIDSAESIHLSFFPALVNKQMNVLVHIQGLVNVSKYSSSLLYVEGMSLGYKMWSGEPTQDKMTHLMTINNRTYYDGSETDGTMSASFYTFGDAANEVKADDDNIARLSFALRDGTTHPDVERNISEKLNTSTDLVQIDIEIGLGESDDDPYITLPDVEDKETSGLDAEVGDWGDDIVIDLPL